MVRAFAHGAMGRRIDPSWCTMSYFSFQPVLHVWCNKGRGIYYPVCEVVHIKDSLLLIGNSRTGSGGRGFLGVFSLSEWSFTICMTQYNCK